jgi:RNA polymerase sigma-70 factor (ECF subfamily)
MSDGDLVRQALAGRSEAYEELVRRWARRIKSLCYAKVGSADVADDLAQDSLLRGYRCLASLADPEKFGAWLCSIARNACLNWLQAKERSVLSFSTLPPDENPNYFPDRQHPGSETTLEREEELRQLKNEVERLPPECREVLLLYYSEDVTYGDLAQMLGVSTATVNARLTRARTLLRERLGVPRR